MIFMYFMWQSGLKWACIWYAEYFIPIKLLLTAATYVQAVHVRRDIAAHERGETTRFGVPHHGVLLINAIQGLIYFPVYWLQTVWMIKIEMQYELVLFGIASILTTAAGIVGVQIVRWMERAPKEEPHGALEPSAQVF